MKQFLLTLVILIGTAWTFEVSAIHSTHAPATMQAFAVSHSMTVNEFLSIDVKGYKTVEGKKLKWTQRLAMNMVQKGLAKKVKKGQIEGTATMDMAAPAAGHNTYGLLSIIFSVVGLVVPFLGLAMIIAGLVLGIIGIKRDANPTMAIIGTVISSVFLLLLLLALAILASGAWFWG